MISQPLDELRPIQPASSDPENDALLLSYFGGNLMAVQYQERFHRRMANPLVAIHKRMPLDDGKAESSRLFGQIRVQFCATEGLAGLGYG